MPKIIPITDLRNTTKISELCHEKNEPVFITKNGYSDLVIMSAEAYEELTEGPKAARATERPEEMYYLTEQSPMWAGMLADVLQQRGVPFFKESSLGAGLAIKTGGLSERIRFFVPQSYLMDAKNLVEELFSQGTE